MAHLSEEAKQVIINKALNRNSQTMAEIALTNNIGHSTLSRWVKCFRLGENRVINKKTSATTSTSLAERFKHLQATSGQESVTVSAYCRKHGLYPHQLTQWEADFMADTVHPKKQQISAELKELRAENKALKHIIVRKDKVLAETVALLVLKKKAAHIWGESEED
jgi:transposase